MKSSGRVPSSRGGVLSTVFSNPDGIIETDGLTTRGMSGGMVTLRDSSNLIGIVARGEFDPGTGAVKFYGVLPAYLVADEFKLVEQAGSCSELPRMTRKFAWTARDPAQRLGVREGEGYCFLTGVWGIMDNRKDAVEIGVDKGSKEYVLGGKASVSGSHGAYAQCVRF